MTVDRFSHIHKIARDLLHFVPLAESAHYRVPQDHPAVEAQEPPELLLTELRRFFGAKLRRHAAWKLRFESAPLTGADAFELLPRASGVLIRANGDTGFLAALYELEALLVAGQLRQVKRCAPIATRIGRIFCAPINRPPLYHDELMDGFDYYPPPYLNELARSGVNRIWISSDFRKLTGPGSEERLKRLLERVRRCAPFGIKIYIFCIEPIAYEPDDPILKKYPELGGQHAMGKVAFCPSSPRAQRYLEETTKRIFSSVPGLGGILSITVGEWLTLCCNVPHGQHLKCPNCGDTPAWQTLNTSLSAMLRGMHAADPATEFVSWPYTQTGWWSEPEALEAASHPLPGVKLAHNFESGGCAVQLGKLRNVKDYWLSFTGPSDFYREAARRQVASGGEMFAKLQICCSTESDTTGYLPVPALLYRKYRQLHDLHVSGVIMGWYFGCYPSLMTRAAHRLSQAPFPRSEGAFLRELAAERWGKGRAAAVAGIWKRFSDAFAGYPLSNQLGYTGPMHDSIVWDLHLFPVNRRLAASWVTDVDIPGDRIFDCLNMPEQWQNDFTIDEMIRLTGALARKWNRAAADLAALDDGTLDAAQKLEIVTARAAGLIFADAAEIFRFYQLREQLIFRTPSLALLKKMRAIVERSIGRSREMLECTRQTPVLGFHSEAAEYKFTPARIRWRIRRLQRRLEQDFPRAEKFIRLGKSLRGALAAGLRVPAGEAVLLGCIGEHRMEFAGAFPCDRFFREEARKPETAVTVVPESTGWQLTLQMKKSCENEKFQLYWEPFPGRPSEWIVFDSQGKICYWAKHQELEIRREECAGGGYRLTMHLPGTFFGVPHSGSMIRFNVMREYPENGKNVAHYLCEPHYLPWVYTLGTRDPRDSAVLELK